MPIKVAHLTPLYFDRRSLIGGAERYVVNLARGMVEATQGEIQVEILSFDREPRVEPLYPGITMRLLRASNFHNPLNVVSWELPDAVASADVVHIHQAAMRASELTLLVCKQQKKPVTVTDHGSVFSRAGVCEDRWSLYDRIICQSNYAVAMIRSQTPRPMDVVKGGVDAQYFCPPAQRPKRDRILYVGRLAGYKGADILVEAMPKDLPLTICGNPQRGHERFFERLQTLARGKNIEFVTNATDDQVRDLYRRAWVNVLPSQYQDCFGNIEIAPEYMGFTLLEAMCCGTPVICARVAAMPEFVLEGETGFAFENKAQLTEQLLRFAHNPDLVERMGARAREVMLQEYDIRVAGAKMARIYREMLAARKETAA